MNERTTTPIPVCRGVRGATTVTENDKDSILNATRELLFIMVRSNNIDPADVASAIFTTTADLNVTYPALAARQMGWYDVPLLCSNEIGVDGGLPMCVRILLHWNTVTPQKEIHHIYLHGAKGLRPDKDTIPEIPQEEIEAAVNHLMSIVPSN